MIRFVVSDVGGTLLQEGQTELSDRILEQIPELKEKGILFGVASSRNYDELKGLFGNLKKDILYITNNGAVVIFDEEIVCKSIIDRRLAMDLIKDVKAQEGCDVCVAGEMASYVAKKKESFVQFMKDGIKLNPTEVDEFYKIREDITKVSVHVKGGVNQDLVDYFCKKWGNKTQILITDPEWIDFMAPYVTKGNAIAAVQHLYEISVEDTMTFGANFDDEDMFMQSYYSYAMQNAHPDIKSQAKHIAQNVESILEDVIRI